MTAKDLLEQLSKVSPDTEIVWGMFNGRVDTYTVLNKLHVFLYDQIYADFSGRQEPFCEYLLAVKANNARYWMNMDVEGK